MGGKINIQEIIKDYDFNDVTIGVLGGHSALDICHGAKKYGFKTLAICKKGREKTYAEYYKSSGEKGCVDEVMIVDEFSDILNENLQKTLREKNTIFIHNRYFWVYFNDFSQIENNFKVPIFGLREGVKLEERDQPLNQYHLLSQAGIRIPKIVREGESRLSEEKSIDLMIEHFKTSQNPLIVKANEAIRTYERAFFVISDAGSYMLKKAELISKRITTQELIDKATIEEFIIGAQVNLNFFYSTLDNELELMGTDSRRQTSLDGFLRLDAVTQSTLLENGFKPSMIETGHFAVTMKESLLEKAF
ncbi:5-formaminoimidazole-4-carboxamide-1-(beta)-D-ribofuranosyl 5'-monophosphate synthetase, partial [Candidatus Peregrinibacteria bacterium RIFOXYC2_FULL_33_13]